MAIGAVLAVAGLGVAGAVVASGNGRGELDAALEAAGEDRGGRDEEDGVGEESATAAVLDPDAAPADVFDHASTALDDAGTFSYEASARIEVSEELSANGGPIVIDRDLVGDVVLPASLRETSDDADGFHGERIAAGVGVSAGLWRRDTAFAGQLDARPWAQAGSDVGELDPFRMPDWLDDAVDTRDGGEDPSGQRVVHGTVPVAVVGRIPDVPDLEVISATVELTVTDQGEPQRALIEVATRSFVAETDYVLSGLGDGLTIEPPAQETIDATPWFNEEDLAAYEAAAPMGLGGIPEGWAALRAFVQPDHDGCPTAVVVYGAPDEPVAEFLRLETAQASCVPPPVGDPVQAAGFSGAAAEDEDGMRWGVVTSGETAVLFATDLTVSEVEVVLGTLEPLDLASEPDPIEGIATEGV